MNPETIVVSLTCIAPEQKDLLDEIVEAWEAFRGNQEMSNYSFAYWLVRYSGLIKSAKDS